MTGIRELPVIGMDVEAATNRARRNRCAASAERPPVVLVAAAQGKGVQRLPVATSRRRHHVCACALCRAR
jgi:hypothetical protein